MKEILLTLVTAVAAYLLGCICHRHHRVPPGGREYPQ